MNQKKKILDITTKGWSEAGISKLKKDVKSLSFKYQVIFEQGKKTKYAYTSDPELTETYLKSIGAVILKIKKIRTEVK